MRRSKSAYIEAVTRGEGLMPWQKPGVSEEEINFREEVENRKTEMLSSAAKVRHPSLLTEQHLEQARANIDSAKWARRWFQQHRKKANYILKQDENYVLEMLSELTPWVGYTFICPNCFGVKSQEGAEYTIIDWDYRRPNHIGCKKCGQKYPSGKYPETGELSCPRSGQTLTFYLNDAERQHPEDRSGKYAWRWANYPVHVCFSGIVREMKAKFMIAGAHSLALLHALTGDAGCAAKVREILLRLTHCNSRWLYHDYWDTVADCDPLYAAWHDGELPIEWKRNLFTSAFEKDSLKKASMLQGYWGAGRLHPSTGFVSVLKDICLAYDLTLNAKANGRPVWDAESRSRIERDLILEWIIEAEPFVGGPGKAESVNNKAPRIYRAQAAVAKCLGITEYAENALRGFDAVCSRSFGTDGFSHETPAYTSMYLAELLPVPETLHGFRWPKGSGETGRINLYKTDPRLKLMLRAVVDQLRPDGRFIPMSDTINTEGSAPSAGVIEIGLKRFPEYFKGLAPTIYRSDPSEYAIFHLDAAETKQDDGLNLPEVLYPDWMTAILRHGEGTHSTLLAMPFSPAGGHRHYDNLSLLYEDRGETILGDHGYLAEAPIQKWIKSTFSHNLVIVDDQLQTFRSDSRRRPAFHMMATSPHLSVVEASSDVYEQCTEYRRLVALFKGPDAETFALDIFKVRGGSKHDWRLFSEIGSSDAGSDGAREFNSLNLKNEKRLKKSTETHLHPVTPDLYETRADPDPPASWQSIWKQKNRSYRLWMLSQSDAVAASFGPAQQTWEQLGRMVRYVDVINLSRDEGDDIESTFIAIHEPSGRRGRMPIYSVELLNVPASAGKNAIALKINSRWGEYLVFAEFNREAEVEGVRFKGHFGVRCIGDCSWNLSLSAETFAGEDFGFSNGPSQWKGRATVAGDDRLIPKAIRPSKWPSIPAGCSNLVKVHNGDYHTGYPVRETGRQSIRLDRFPLRKARSFSLLALRYESED
ncbi:MAG: heparinase II/III family protein [Planctomycetota bacterium]|jgi:hypothetical protein|nr:heparinase II/III family protein [Planctomycetota bacterium]MDP7252293.1 heparinase II/III family protein [Planctomycetota bacterium]